MPHAVAETGGILVMLMIPHFVGDWMFQSYNMAMRKVAEPAVRAKHVLIYTACFAVFFGMTGAGWGVRTVCALAWIGITHFIIDSYKPLYWWRRHVHRMPDLNTFEEFKAMFGTPAGFVVNVTLDQIFHLLTLAPVAYAMR